MSMLILIIAILIIISVILFDIDDIIELVKLVSLFAIAIVLIYKIKTMLENSDEDSDDWSVVENSPKEKWGGLGIGWLCKNDEFPRIATDNDVDVLAYNEGNEKIFGNLNQDFSGDAQLAKRSQIHAQKNKQAVINRSRFTADSIKKYFEDELQACESKAWWDNDELDAIM